MYFDWTYVLVIIGAVICLIASMNVKSTFSRYAKVTAESGMTANDVARRILDLSGASYVKIERISGELTDHYDPSSKVLRLSDSVYGMNSISAIGVAAHECGHAIQDYEEYSMMRVRSSLVPVVNIGSKLSMPLLILGLVLGLYRSLVPLGIILFSLSVLFHVVTLPVEFDASSRAVKILKETGMLNKKESTMAASVLRAAAYTYLAATLSSILQLLRLILIARGGRRRN